MEHKQITTRLTRKDDVHLGGLVFRDDFRDLLNRSFYLELLITDEIRIRLGLDLDEVGVFRLELLYLDERREVILIDLVLVCVRPSSRAWICR